MREVVLYEIHSKGNTDAVLKRSYYFGDKNSKLASVCESRLEEKETGNSSVRA